MYDAGRQPAVNFDCMESQTYESKQEIGIQGCGSSASVLFFFSFIMMVSLVFLNLFIAIILEGFAESSLEQQVRINEECLTAFAETWRKYDPIATGLV